MGVDYLKKKQSIFLLKNVKNNKKIAMMKLRLVNTFFSAVMPIKALFDGVENIKSYDIIQIDYGKSDKSDAKAD